MNHTIRNFIPLILMNLILKIFIKNAVIIIIISAISIYLVVSVIEILMITREMHEHRRQTTFERELAIRLDDFIIERHMDNVSNIVTDFLNEFEEYQGNRTMIYHIACQIMETHRRELWEKTLKTRLKLFLEKTDEKALREIIEKFLKKYPEYRKDPEKVYQLSALYIDKMKQSP